MCAGLVAVHGEKNLGALPSKGTEIEVFQKSSKNCKSTVSKTPKEKKSGSESSVLAACTYVHSLCAWCKTRKTDQPVESELSGKDFLLLLFYFFILNQLCGHNLILSAAPKEKRSQNQPTTPKRINRNFERKLGNKTQETERSEFSRR